MTLSEFCLIERGHGREAMKRTCVKGNCADYTFHLLPPTSLDNSRKIKILLRGLCQETLSNSAASANIRHWRQWMENLANGISRNLSDWVTNPPAFPENLKPSVPISLLQIRKYHSSDKPPWGRGPTGCPSSPWQMGTDATSIFQVQHTGGG